MQHKKSKYIYACMTACVYESPVIPETPCPMDSLLVSSSSPLCTQILEPKDGTHHNNNSNSAPPPLLHTSHYSQDMPPPPLLLDPYIGAKQPKATSPVSLLGLCTEGLGSESSDDVDLDDIDMDVDVAGHAASDRCKRQHREEDQEEQMTRTRPAVPAVLTRTQSGRAFPPPISVIGTSGRPWVYFCAHRQDGRLVLKEMRIPHQELLQACREDGRLKLQFVHPEEELDEEQEQEWADAAQEHKRKA